MRYNVVSSYGPLLVHLNFVQGIKQFFVIICDRQNTRVNNSFIVMHIRLKLEFCEWILTVHMG